MWRLRGWLIWMVYVSINAGVVDYLKKEIE
jgi:hypothetical protein